jgi:hypothetical protein
MADSLAHNLGQARFGLPLPRRSFLAGAAGGALLLLPACQTMQGVSLTDAVRRLLLLSSERAFTRLVAPDGYWDQTVATLGLPTLLGTRGNTVASILTSTLFKQRLEGAFADIAIDGTARVAPMVTEAVRTIGIENALALVNGGPTAASEFLRGAMGTRLVEAMVPELGQAFRVAQEPLVGQLLAGLTGVDVAGVADDLATTIDNVIWQQIGIEEAAIRTNPRATNDSLLIGVFTAAAAL